MPKNEFTWKIEWFWHLYKKLPNNVGDLVKIIVATGFELLPKVEKSCHTGQYQPDSTQLSKLPMRLLWIYKYWLNNFSEGQWSLLTPDVRSSNPVSHWQTFTYNICILSTVMKRRKEIKRDREWPIKTTFVRIKAAC